MRADTAAPRRRTVIALILVVAGALGSGIAISAGYVAPGSCSPKPAPPGSASFEPASLEPAAHAPIAFPQGYTRWTHIKSGLIPAGHPAFASYGGLHHIYANELALAGYRDGRYADGSVLAYDLFETRVTADGSIDQGPRRHVDVMVKDARRYAATGGWGYAEFAAGADTDRLDSDQRAGCAACHEHRKAQGYVFSELQG